MKVGSRYYLDYAATTPLDERVLSSMLPFFTEQFGNPSSIHLWGQNAETALEYARETVASALGAEPEEIIFTGCGTESDNLAVRGTAFRRRKSLGANRLLISPVEHHAVLETARQLADHFGFILEFLPVDKYGRVDPQDVEVYIKPDTALVSIVFANNEIGTINPISEIGQICRRRGVPFHTDAVQAAAHLNINVQKLNVDLLAIGAHKFYGPKGIGALYVRKGIDLLPLITGGKQERGLRAGTQNIPYIVGLAEALKLAAVEMKERVERLQPLRDELIRQILQTIPQCRLTGDSVNRLPNHASFVIKNLDANLLLALLDRAGFACSSGSACKVGTPEPSEILTAIGFPPEWALGSLRITLGRDTNHEVITDLLNVLPNLVEQARGA